MLLSPWLELLMKRLTRHQLVAFMSVLLFMNLSLLAKGAFPWGNQIGGTMDTDVVHMPLCMWTCHTDF